MEKWTKACLSAGVAALVIQLVNPDPDAIGSMAQDFAVFLPMMRVAGMLEGSMCGVCSWLRGPWR